MRVSSARWRQWSGSLKCGALDMEQTPLHSTGSYATVKVGPPPAQPERPLPAIASPSASRALKGNCFLKLPCPNPTAGLQSTQKNKTEESNGCSDIHHEIGSGRVI